jgi:phosphoglycolate phosphatase
MSLPRRWDEFEACIFDVDGTLLNCADAVHYFAFCEVLSSVVGREVNLDGVTAHGNTDVGILRDAFSLAGLAHHHWRPRLPELCDELCSKVERNRASLCVEALPQVREVLGHLRAKGVLLRLATGNLERIGKQKLAAAGLLQFFPAGTWSDSFEDRNDVFRQAVEEIREDTHQSAAILAFGDTPADVSAARANGIPVIAVATGVFSYERLMAESPSLSIRSFAELMDPEHMELTRSITCSNSRAR